MAWGFSLTRALTTALTRTLTIGSSENNALITPDALAARLAEYAENARGAYARNTERARAADSKTWVDWCLFRGFSSLPSEPAAVVAFIEDQALSKAPATIARYIQTIAHMHRAAGIEPPTRALVVALALRRMRREKGVAQRQAKPLGASAVRTIIRATLEDLEPPRRRAKSKTKPERKGEAQARARAFRDAALLALAYASAMRRSELVALEWSDLELEGDDEGFGSVAIRRSKSDQEGRGQTRGLPPDVAQALRFWRDAAGSPEGGAVFVSARGVRLCGDDVAHIIKRRASAAGLDGAAFSGHSTRVGATVDRVSAGETTEQIKRATGHKSDRMITRYGANANVRADARRAFGKLGKLFEPGSVTPSGTGGRRK